MKNGVGEKKAIYNDDNEQIGIIIKSEAGGNWHEFLVFDEDYGFSFEALMEIGEFIRELNDKLTSHPTPPLKASPDGRGMDGERR